MKLNVLFKIRKEETMGDNLCKNCREHERAPDSNLCGYCQEKFCVACELADRIEDSNFCKNCKDPEKIIVVCRGCGNRFWLTPEEQGTKMLFQFDGIKHIGPKNGMTVSMTRCNVCYHKNKGETVKIVVL